MRFFRLTMTLAVALSPTLAQSQTTAYGIAFYDTYALNLATANVQLIGRAGNFGNTAIGDIEGLALSRDGVLFGASDGLGALVRISQTTGAATVVGSLGLAGQGVGSQNSLDFGLAFTCNGKLWLSSATTGKIWTVNPANGATTFVGHSGAKLSGLAARGDELFGIGVRGDEALYRVNTTTGVATLVGRLTPAIAFISDAGLDFDSSGRLWATLDFNPPLNGPAVEASDLIEINPSTGAILSRKTITGAPRNTDFEGLAITPTVCAVNGGPISASPIPTTSHWSLALIASLMALFGLVVIATRQRW